MAKYPYEVEIAESIQDELFEISAKLKELSKKMNEMDDQGTELHKHFWQLISTHTLVDLDKYAYRYDIDDNALICTGVLEEDQENFDKAMEMISELIH